MSQGWLEDLGSYVAGILDVAVTDVEFETLGFLVSRNDGPVEIIGRYGAIAIDDILNEIVAPYAAGRLIRELHDIPVLIHDLDICPLRSFDDEEQIHVISHALEKSPMDVEACRCSARSPPTISG